MATTSEPPEVHFEKNLEPTQRELSSSNGSSTKPERNLEFQPPSRYQTRHGLDIDDYFAGPRDMQKHSKLPFFMRVHGSVTPKMLLPLTFVGAWATAITCISQIVHPLGEYLMAFYWRSPLTVSQVSTRFC